MRPPPVRLGAIPWLFRAVLLTAAYFVIAKLGLRYATIGPSISPVWPPTGLAIAALVLFGLRYWPAVLAGAFLANVTTRLPTLAAFRLACGNPPRATTAGYLLLRRARPQARVDEVGYLRPQDRDGCPTR